MQLFIYYVGWSKWIHDFSFHRYIKFGWFINTVYQCTQFVCFYFFFLLFNVNKRSCILCKFDWFYNNFTILVIRFFVVFVLSRNNILTKDEGGREGVGFLEFMNWGIAPSCFTRCQKTTIRCFCFWFSSWELSLNNLHRKFMIYTFFFNPFHSLVASVLFSLQRYFDSHPMKTVLIELSILLPFD